MNYRFHKHYTQDEAQALLPSIRGWLERLNGLRKELEKAERALSALLNGGSDAGGPTANKWVRVLVDIKETLGEFQRREILIKDLERGLIDFPAIMEGREVFLCWEQDEEVVEFWHELDAGYAGREKLPGPD